MTIRVRHRVDGNDAAAFRLRYTERVSQESLDATNMSKDPPDNGETELGDLSFEEALGLLDETVQALEAGGLSLAEATETYERGMRLARVCNEMLASAELRVTQVRAAFGEQMRMLEDQESDSQVDGPPC